MPHTYCLLSHSILYIMEICHVSFVDDSIFTHKERVNYAREVRFCVFCTVLLQKFVGLDHDSWCQNLIQIDLENIWKSTEKNGRAKTHPAMADTFHVVIRKNVTYSDELNSLLLLSMNRRRFLFSIISFY